MDQSDERHLFDLIVNPVAGVLTSILVPLALVLSGLSVLSGRLLYAIPFVFVLVLGLLDLALFLYRFLSSNFSKSSSRSYHRTAFCLLIGTLLLSVVVILTVFSSGTVDFGPGNEQGRVSS